MFAVWVKKKAHGCHSSSQRNVFHVDVRSRGSRESWFYTGERSLIWKVYRKINIAWIPSWIHVRLSEILGTNQERQQMPQMPMACANDIRLNRPPSLAHVQEKDHWLKVWHSRNRKSATFPLLLTGFITSLAFSIDLQKSTSCQMLIFPLRAKPAWLWTAAWVFSYLSSKWTKPLVT